MRNTKKAPVRALMEDPTITVEESAALLGLSRNGAYNAIREGEIPSIRIGRSIRVPCAALRKMLGYEEARHDEHLPATPASAP
jgi:excisionase family DNA binding protein